jgi:enoyl-CoA hydratase/carnithine racemase
MIRQQGVSRTPRRPRVCFGFTTAEPRRNKEAARASATEATAPDGFVRQDVDPRDRRNRVISLTQKGRAKLRESELLWARAQKKFDKSYGPAASAALREALALNQFGALFHTNDFIEGRRAEAEGRKPVYHGD